jgi:hypothetical protein
MRATNTTAADEAQACARAWGWRAWGWRGGLDDRLLQQSTSGAGASGYVAIGRCLAECRRVVLVLQCQVLAVAQVGAAPRQGHWTSDDRHDHHPASEELGNAAFMRLLCPSTGVATCPPFGVKRSFLSALVGALAAARHYSWHCKVCMSFVLSSLSL